MRKRVFFLTLLLICVSCSKVNEKSIENLIINHDAPWAYMIDGQGYSLKNLRADYKIFIQLNFPKSLQDWALNSKENWNGFAKLRQKQDLVIVHLFQTDLFYDPTFNYFLRQGIREALIKGYLYKNIPDLDKIKESKYDDNQRFIDKIYLENKKLYDEKKIGKEEALRALKQVYFEKKNTILDYLLRKEELKIVSELEKKYKITDYEKEIEKYNE